MYLFSKFFKPINYDTSPGDAEGNCVYNRKCINEISLKIIGRAEFWLIKTIETWRGRDGWGLRFGVSTN